MAGVWLLAVFADETNDRLGPKAPTHVVAPQTGTMHAHGNGHGHSHMDARALVHERDLEAQLKPGHFSTLQTILFGLSGGLVPYHSAITVLLSCLQIKKVAIRLVMIFTSFSHSHA